jgi:hypothetical protein
MGLKSIPRASPSCIRVAMRPVSTPLQDACAWWEGTWWRLQTAQDHWDWAWRQEDYLGGTNAVAGVEPARWSQADGLRGEGSNFFLISGPGASGTVEWGGNRSGTGEYLGQEQLWHRLHSTRLLLTYCPSRCSFLFYLLYNHFFDLFSSHVL